MDEVEINSEKSFKLDLETDKNNLYTINFNLNDSIEIFAEQINNFIHKSFSGKYSSREINENKYFLQFDSLSEIFDEIKLRISDNKIKIKEEENNLQIKIPLPSQKHKEIVFDLKMKSKNNDEKINDIIELVIKLKKECNNLKEENNKFQNEIINLKNENKQLKNNITEMKGMIDCLWKGRNSSKIINGNELYYQNIKTWINSSKNIKMKLLYRLSENGNKYSTFHQLCDNKGPTLTLFHVTDGNKVGIYTPLSWGSSDGWKNDMETFIFNLNKGKKSKKITVDYSEYNSSSCGPWIGTFGCSSSNTMSSIKHCASTIDYCYDHGSGILPSGFETKIYNLFETEVYQIIFE